MPKVNFFSGPGHKLAGVLFTPNGVGKVPGVVVCHGYAGNKEANMPKIAERLAEAGFAALIFDYRGFGESEGPRFRLIPQEQVEDIRNALTFLQTRPEVDESRLGLFGMSFGGSTCISAAASDSRVLCTISAIAIGNGERWLHLLRREWEWREFQKKLKSDRLKRVVNGESERVHPYDIMMTTPEGWKFWEETVKINPDRANTKVPLESADAIIEFKPEDMVGQISPRSVLFVSTEEDGLCPMSEQLSLYERAREPKKLKVMHGIDHHEIYKQPYFDEFMRESVEWLDKYLK